MTISNLSAEDRESIEDLPVEERLGMQVPLFFTGSLYDSETLRSTSVHRARAHVRDHDESEVAILLMDYA